MGWHCWKIKSNETLSSGFFSSGGRKPGFGDYCQAAFWRALLLLTIDMSPSIPQPLATST